MRHDATVSKHNKNKELMEITWVEIKYCERRGSRIPGSFPGVKHRSEHAETLE